MLEIFRGVRGSGAKNNSRIFKSDKINILIDDIRLFQGKFQNYPNKNTLVSWCKENNFLWEIEQDIFICKKI